MPKRKWNRLHDEQTIADERDLRSRRLREQRDARASIDEAIADQQDAPAPPAEPGPITRPPPRDRDRDP